MNEMVFPKSRTTEIIKMPHEQHQWPRDLSNISNTDMTMYLAVSTEALLLKSERLSGTD